MKHKSTGALYKLYGLSIICHLFGIRNWKFVIYFSMPYKNLEKVFKKYKILLAVGLGAGILALILTLIFYPLEYRADAQVLIISQSRFGVDPYTVVKSAERIGENLIQVMKTEDFANKVLAYKDGIVDKIKFGDLDQRERRKLWESTLDVSVISGTGVLNIAVFNPDPEIAKEIAEAVAGTLTSRGWEYVGGDVAIKVINNPVATRFPVRPNLPLNFLIGFLAGLSAMSLVVIRKK